MRAVRWCLPIGLLVGAGCNQLLGVDDVALGDDEPAPIDAPPTGGDGRELDAAIDAPEIDASGWVTLSQTTSDTIVDGHGVVCAQSPPIEAVRDNRFFRVFPIDTAFTAETVGIAIEETNGPLALDVRLHTVASLPPTAASLVELTSQAVSLPGSAQLSRIDVPLDSPQAIAAGTNLVVELHVADGVGAGRTFHPGTNGSGQTADAYILAADCAFTEMSTFEQAGFPNVHLILSVSGTIGGP